MLLAAGREVVSKTSAYNITNLSYRVEVRVYSAYLGNSHPTTVSFSAKGRDLMGLV